MGVFLPQSHLVLDPNSVNLIPSWICRFGSFLEQQVPEVHCQLYKEKCFLLHETELFLVSTRGPYLSSCGICWKIVQHSLSIFSSALLWLFFFVRSPVDLLPIDNINKYSVLMLATSKNFFIYSVILSPVMISAVFPGLEVRLVSLIILFFLRMLFRTPFCVGKTMNPINTYMGDYQCSLLPV